MMPILELRWANVHVSINMIHRLPPRSRRPMVDIAVRVCSRTKPPYETHIMRCAFTATSPQSGGASPPSARGHRRTSFCAKKARVMADITVVPLGLREALNDYDLEDMSEVFSLSTWQQTLTESDRAQLRALLPESKDATREVAVRELFDGEPLFFGAPLAHCWNAMKAGELSSEAVAATVQDDEAQRQLHTQHQRQHHNNMVHKLHHLKRTYTPPTPVPPSARGKPGGGGVSAGENLVYKEGSGLTRKKGVPGRKGGLEEGGDAPEKAGGGRRRAPAAKKEGAKEKKTGKGQKGKAVSHELRVRERMCDRCARVSAACVRAHARENARACASMCTSMCASICASMCASMCASERVC